MSLNLIGNIINAQIKGIGGMTKLVLIGLASHADDEGNGIRPSIATLAKECGTTRDTIYEHIYRLMATGVLIDTEEWHHYGRGHRSTIYRVDVPTLSKLSTLSGKSTLSKKSTHSVEKTRSAVSKRRTQTSPINQPGQESLRSSLDQPVPEMSEEVSEYPSSASRTQVDSPSYENWDSERAKTMFGQEILAFVESYCELKSIRPDSERGHQALDSIAAECADTLSHNYSYHEDFESVDQALLFFWNWNQSHKRNKLKFGSLSHLLKALKSGSENGLISQALVCKQGSPCQLCKNETIRKNGKAPMTGKTRNLGFQPLCLNCDKPEKDCTCPGGAVIVKGFEVEEAELA